MTDNNKTRDDRRIAHKIQRAQHPANEPSNLFANRSQAAAHPFFCRKAREVGGNLLRISALSLIEESGAAVLHYRDLLMQGGERYRLKQKNQQLSNTG